MRPLRHEMQGISFMDHEEEVQVRLHLFSCANLTGIMQ